MIVRLKGVPPDAFLVQDCPEPHCRAKTIHGPVSRLTWAWADGGEGVRVRPFAECRRCGVAYTETFELEGVDRR